MNSPLKVGKGMVGGLMGCWMMIGPDVEKIRILLMLETQLTRLLPFQFAAFSPVFCQTLAAVQSVCMCHQDLELIKTGQTSLSVWEEV